MIRHSLEVKLAAFLAEYAPAEAAASWLVAISGGADSMALLYGLVRLRDQSPGIAGLHVGHVNHQLRGTDSDGDAEFVAEHAEKLGLPCTIEKADVASAMRESGESLETAARKLRHRLLSDIAHRTGCTIIALAHTADDQAETVLHRLLRGTGLRGLAGIAPRREQDNLTLLRPLLAVSRREVEDYLAALDIPCRTDASNARLDHTRNRLRHELLPLLRANYNPNINDALTQLASIARDTQEIIAADVGELLGALVKSSTPRRLVLHRTALKQLPRIQQVQVLHACMDRLSLPQRDITFSHFNSVLDLIANETSVLPVLNWPGNWRLSREGDNLILDHCPPPKPVMQPALPDVPLNIPGTTTIPIGYLYFDAADGQTRPLAMITIECHERTSVSDVAIFANPEPKAVWLDADAVAGNRLILRTRQAGDRLHALGSPGSKTLGDFLTDHKAPIADRDRLGLVCDEAGIIWLPALTLTERVKVIPSTTRLLRLSVHKKE
ncbi:MAG: tRNA lysidine(34) synthetase TilS [Sedimentisphaerales bacterium]|nr:tRNA lysidine(34) synthetase TilS [Sedimentisphaerales bacterium]